ncbi:sulfatase-like hydrolase/transferase [Halosimplex rubrum]|uniref:Sulfatase-like hydrolase/transferase n=1 Tax=Halosimplex rubrum TaxID=869889 RepID=A0A7D5TQJ0_9EURY|nr:sulfatase-like hydrolase/transferase [Halosimplex rubrum]QLH78914.1 sulfatase-like hydrolase/transferase [Halosimplex rubrum]
MSSPNVLLVILDSLRARNCSLHGHGAETTPFLSQFADEATVFDQARAPSIHSIASHASIFSGYHVEEHEVTEHKDFLRPEATLWHRLGADHGYETGFFTPNVIVTETSNLGEAFDTCVGPKRTKSHLFEGALAPNDVEGNLTPAEFTRLALGHERPVRSFLNGVYEKLSSRGGSQDPDAEDANVYVDEFESWLDDRSGPWAACLNLMDTHTPFVPHDAYDRWSDGHAAGRHGRGDGDESPEAFTDEFWTHLQGLEGLYDGTIRQADAAVERLVETLRERDALDDTLVVVTSDHGEGFGERSDLVPGVRLRHHSWGIDERLTHVPLVVSTPGEGGGERVREAASLTQFPAAVEAALDGEDAAAAFVPEGPVVSSTYRIRPPGDELDLPPAECERYFGPWRAVYRTTDEGVVKHARRGDDAGEFLIPDAQTVERRADTDGGEVAAVFDGLRETGVKVGSAADRDMTGDVEDRLADLGYLR